MCPVLTLYYIIVTIMTPENEHNGWKEQIWESYKLESMTH